MEPTEQERVVTPLWKEWWIWAFVLVMFAMYVLVFIYGRLVAYTSVLEFIMDYLYEHHNDIWIEMTNTPEWRRVSYDKVG